MSDLEEYILSQIGALEEDGVDFTREIGMIVFELTQRPDLSFQIYICDKEVQEEFMKPDWEEMH